MENVCDIILLSYENPDLLRKCVNSIFAHTKIRVKLIIVDNASTSGEVRDFLNTVSGNRNVEVEKILSEENAGFAGGINKGMKVSRAPYVCLLNNDCIVTDGWLEEMISVVSSDEAIGIVNPQSNTFGSYPDHSVEINEHAGLLSDKRGKYLELGHAIGFACLIKREVIDKIGYLDESYEGVCYEDTDYSIRARHAGYIPVMAEGAYVYHKEQASRRDMPGKEAVYSRNKGIFEERWGRLLRVFYMDKKTQAYDTRGICEIYEVLKKTARERVIVDMYIPVSPGSDRRVFDAGLCGTLRHADIGIRYFIHQWIDVCAAWKVLTKKKKYDAVIIRNGLLARFLRLFRSVHRSVILVLDGGMSIRGRGMLFNLNKPKDLTYYLRHRK